MAGFKKGTPHPIINNKMPYTIPQWQYEGRI